MASTDVAAAAVAPKLLLSTVAPVLLWAKIEDAI